MRATHAVYLLFFVAAASATVTQEHINRVKAAVVECQKTYNVDVAKIRKLMSTDDAPANEDERCMTKCLLEQFHVLKEGKLDLEAMKSVNQAKYSEANDVENANKVAEACLVTDPVENKCDFANNIWKCFRKESKKYTFQGPAEILPSTSS